jgi:membrane-bound metal-dependent hydrolase YbcI (DUF457 family)
MFAGHFGLAAMVKTKQPEVPLWALMLSTQLLDVFFVPLFLSGAETMEPVGANGYGEAIIHADYTHSLVGALVIALVAGLIAGWAWSKRSGVIIGAMVFSHWLLDLLVHRSDLPILPGNYGNLPLMGFELWEVSYVSIGLELLLIAVGSLMYFRSALRRADALRGQPRVHQSGSVPRGEGAFNGQSRVHPSSKRWAVTAGIVMTGLLILSLVTDVMGAG